MNKPNQEIKTESQGRSDRAGVLSARNTWLSAKKGVALALVAVLLIVSAAAGNFTGTNAASTSTKAKSTWVLGAGNKCSYYLDKTGTKTAKFVKKSGKWYYYTYDKTTRKFKKETFAKKRNTIQKLNGTYFYVKKDGSIRVKKGWQKVNSKKKILVGADASVSAKYEKKNGKWVYKEYKKYNKTVNGTKKTAYGFKTVKNVVRTLSDGKLYYFNKNGVKTTKTGWKSISAKKRVYVGTKGYVTKVQTRKNASGSWKTSGAVKSNGTVTNEKDVCDHNWVDKTKLTYHKATYKTGTVYVDKDGNEYSNTGSYEDPDGDGVYDWVDGDVTQICAALGSDGKTYVYPEDQYRAEYYNNSIKFTNKMVYIHETEDWQGCGYCNGCNYYIYPDGKYSFDSSAPCYVTDWYYFTEAEAAEVRKTNGMIVTQAKADAIAEVREHQKKDHPTIEKDGVGMSDGASFITYHAYVMLTKKTGQVIDTPAYYTKKVTGSYCTKCGKTK